MRRGGGLLHLHQPWAWGKRPTPQYLSLPITTLESGYNLTQQSRLEIERVSPRLRTRAQDMISTQKVLLILVTSRTPLRTMPLAETNYQFARSSTD